MTPTPELESPIFDSGGLGYYKLLYEGERNMRFVRQDQLMSPEGEARGGHELVEPDKSHVTRLPSIITFLSHDVKINKIYF